MDRDIIISGVAEQPAHVDGSGATPIDGRIGMNFGVGHTAVFPVAAIGAQKIWLAGGADLIVERADQHLLRIIGIDRNIRFGVGIGFGALAIWNDVDNAEIK